MIPIQVQRSRSAMWRLSLPRSPASLTLCRKSKLCSRIDWWALRHLSALWLRGRTPPSRA
eukprot:4163854-Alexandrium_andersonii.AAC.1